MNRRPVRGLAFIDTETTGLGPSAVAWEVGLIIRDGFVPDGSDKRCLIQIDGFTESHFDPEALAVSGFSERYGKSPEAQRFGLPTAAASVAMALRDRYLVAANPAYDAAIIERMLRACRLEPAWHFRLIDVEALAMGAKGWWEPKGLQATAAALGISFEQDDMHTAMGDADLVRRIHDHLIWSNQ